MLRSEIVEKLIDAATEGMLEEAKHLHVTSNEIFSAYLTLTLRAIVFYRDQGADIAAMRSALERIYSELPQSRVQ